MSRTANDDLQQAVGNNDISGISSSIRNGANVNFVHDYGLTSLQRAVCKASVESIKVLLANGAFIDQCTSWGDTALATALRFEDVAVIEQLLNQGADLKAIKNKEFSPFRYAVCNLEITKMLIDKGADVDLCDVSGNTPLIHSIIKRKSDVFRYLLTVGADINKANKSIETPLSLALREGNSEYAEILNQTRPTAILNHFIRTGDYENVKHLLSRKVNINLRDEEGNSRLSYAIKTRNLTITELLLDNGAQFSIPSAFLNAIADGDLKIIQLLIRKGANVNLKYRSGNTPLLEAIKNENLEVVKLLIESGADVNLVGKNGTSPLVQAVEKNQLATVQKLIESGCNIDLPDNKADYLLAKSLENKQLEIVEVLVKSGAKVVANISPSLLEFLEKRNTKMVKLFIDHGADLNVIGKCGHTVLTKCVEMDDLEMVEFLLTKQVNVNEIDRNGNTALILAAKNSNFIIFENLVNAGGDVEMANETLDEVANDNEDFAVYLESLRRKKNKADYTQKDCFKSLPNSINTGSDQEESPSQKPQS